MTLWRRSRVSPKTLDSARRRRRQAMSSDGRPALLRQRDCCGRGKRRDVAEELLDVVSAASAWGTPYDWTGSRGVWVGLAAWDRSMEEVADLACRGAAHRRPPSGGGRGGPERDLRQPAPSDVVQGRFRDSGEGERNRRVTPGGSPGSGEAVGRELLRGRWSAIGATRLRTMRDDRHRRDAIAGGAVSLEDVGAKSVSLRFLRQDSRTGPIESTGRNPGDRVAEGRNADRHRSLQGPWR